MTDSRGTSVIEGAMARWSSPLESILFGTQDPDEVEDLLREYCSRHFGRRLEEVLFYERGVGAVFGIRIDDGNDVVVKVHRPDIGQGLDVVVQVQRHLSTLGVPAPRPLAAPAPLALGIATTEGLLDRGRVGNAHDPLVRRVLTRGLFEFVEAATPLASSVRALPGHLFNSPDDSLWPIPHDARFDLSAPGGEWIDDVAAQAKRRLRLPHGRRVVGHEDWRVENLRVDGDRIVAIFDWDSLVLAHEPVLVGQNSTSFTADWANPDVEPYPSLDESTAFVDDYEGRPGVSVHGGRVRDGRCIASVRLGIQREVRALGYGAWGLRRRRTEEWVEGLASRSTVVPPPVSSRAEAGHLRRACWALEPPLSPPSP